MEKNMVTLLALVLYTAPVHLTTPVILITSDHVCKVQKSIRHKNVIWSAKLCKKIADAYNSTFAPWHMFAISINESDMRYNVHYRAGKHKVDVGLTGVRCFLNRYGRCTNWPVKNWTISDLKNPVKNIEAGAKILKQKLDSYGAPAFLHRYNGSSRENGYTKKINVIFHALHGTLVKTEDVRVRKLASSIIASR
jgi:hypothetical protein